MSVHSFQNHLLSLSDESPLLFYRDKVPLLNYVLKKYFLAGLDLQGWRLAHLMCQYNLVNKETYGVLLGIVKTSRYGIERPLIDYGWPEWSPQTVNLTLHQSACIAHHLWTEMIKDGSGLDEIKIWKDRLDILCTSSFAQQPLVLDFDAKGIKNGENNGPLYFQSDELKEHLRKNSHFIRAWDECLTEWSSDEDMTKRTCLTSLTDHLLAKSIGRALWSTAYYLADSITALEGRNSVIPGLSRTGAINALILALNSVLSPCKLPIRDETGYSANPFWCRLSDATRFQVRLRAEHLNTNHNFKQMTTYTGSLVTVPLIRWLLKERLNDAIGDARLAWGLLRYCSVMGAALTADMCLLALRSLKKLSKQQNNENKKNNVNEPLLLSLVSQCTRQGNVPLDVEQDFAQDGVMAEYITGVCQEWLAPRSDYTTLRALLATKPPHKIN